MDDLRRAAAAGALHSTIAIGSLSLGAAFEIACAATAREVEIAAQADRWRRDFVVLDLAMEALHGRFRRPTDINAAPDIEIRSAPCSGEELDGVEWIEHKDRFRRALETVAGLPGPHARKIAAGYQEMTDNVIAHAAPAGQPQPPSVAGFRVSDTEFEFAVADLGRGVRASLRENQKHSEITTDARALEAAIQERASRRTFAGGTGFRDLNEALTDLDAVLRFRSGDASLTLERRANERIGRIGTSPSLPGLQLAVQWSSRA